MGPVTAAATSNRPITILGRYRGGTDRYIGRDGYNVLNIKPRSGPGSWNWTRNRRFIDNALARGDEIRIVTDPFAPMYRGGNTFQRELRYLRDRGFVFEQIDDYWLVVKGR